MSKETNKTSAVKAKDAAKKAGVNIPPPNFEWMDVGIRGDAPYVQNRFSAKARTQMHDTQAAGSTAKGKAKVREAKDFKACYEGAKHKSADGWCGIPASSFRNAMISACRIVGFTMTRAKLAVFVEADGFCSEDGTPLVKITKGKPKYFETPVRNETGVVDLRARPMWEPGWEASVRIRYDADMFTSDDVMNLMHRVGAQVGLGEGRPDSKKSCGMGWGTFALRDKVVKQVA